MILSNTLFRILMIGILEFVNYNESNEDCS